MKFVKDCGTIIHAYFTFQENYPLHRKIIREHVTICFLFVGRRCIRIFLFFIFWTRWEGLFNYQFKRWEDLSITYIDCMRFALVSIFNCYLVFNLTLKKNVILIFQLCYVWLLALSLSLSIRKQKSKITKERSIKSKINRKSKNNKKNHKKLLKSRE